MGFFLRCYVKIICFCVQLSAMNRLSLANFKSLVCFLKALSGNFLKNFVSMQSSSIVVVNLFGSTCVKDLH